MLTIKRSTRQISRDQSLQAGFSLLEILITLMIVALIATLVGPRLMDSLDRSKTSTARVQAKSIKTALDTMRLDLGRYPTAEEGLKLLSSPPAEGERWRGPYMDGQVPNDPWGKPYIFVAGATPDSAPRIGSFGSDATAGGTGSAEDVYSDDPT
jgi:general secretion pathway protein G